jgi:hypothetical protein
MPVTVLPLTVASMVLDAPSSPMLTPVTLLPDCASFHVPTPLEATPLTVPVAVPVNYPSNQRRDYHPPL